MGAVHSSTYTCLESTITNVSNKTISRLSMFGGIKLLADESFTIAGSPDAHLAGRYPGIKGLRMIRKLRDLVDAGYLAITAIPTAPCGNVWGSSSSDFISA